MQTFKIVGIIIGKAIGVLVCGLCMSGDILAGTAGFGANTGVYNPYAGYSVGNQATFVGENLGLEAGVVGLNALAQKAYRWGNSFNRPKDIRGKFGRYPPSYVQRGTLGRYVVRQPLRATPVPSQASSNGIDSGANISAAFVAQNKEIEQLCAKWQQENPETFLAELKTEEQYIDAYPILRQEALELVEHRRQIKELLGNPHDPEVEEQLRNISHKAYIAASKIDMIILKMVTQEVTTYKDAIIKSFGQAGEIQQSSENAGKFADNIAELSEGDEGDNSKFNKKWLEERQTYLADAVLIWYKRFRLKMPNGDIREINWDQSDPFLKEGYDAWIEAIETEKFIKAQLARYAQNDPNLSSGH